MKEEEIAKESWSLLLLALVPFPIMVDSLEEWSSIVVVHARVKDLGVLEYYYTEYGVLPYSRSEYWSTVSFCYGTGLHGN